MNKIRLKISIFAILGCSPTLAQAPGGYDCKHPDVTDAYAVCVCNAWNQYQAKIKTCMSEACIGAAKIVLDSQVASCSQYMNLSSVDGNFGTNLDFQMAKEPVVEKQFIPQQ